jgi:CheY-like chemotaxis protein
MSVLYLCVDDDAITLMLNRKIIERAVPGATILTALNGSLALSRFNDHSSDPILVLLDLNMPVMDGWEFLDRFSDELSDRYPNCKVVILTSSVDPRDEERAKDYPSVIGFLSKPLSMDRVKELVLE